MLHHFHEKSAIVHVDHNPRVASSTLGLQSTIIMALLSWKSGGLMCMERQLLFQLDSESGFFCKLGATVWKVKNMASGASGVNAPASQATPLLPTPITRPSTPSTPISSSTPPERAQTPVTIVPEEPPGKAFRNFRFDFAVILEQLWGVFIINFCTCSLWKPDSFFYGCFFDDLFYVHLLSCHQMKWQNLKITSCVVSFSVHLDGLKSKAKRPQGTFS